MDNSNIDEITQEQKVAFLEANGELVYLGSVATLVLKYYHYGDYVYKIAYSDDKAVLVSKLSLDEMSRISANSDLDFGAW